MVRSPPPPPNVVQERPDIIIATPGRLWELLSADPQPYLKTLDKLRFFVLDEVDRMVDAGHFKELDNILQLLQQKSNGGSGVEGEEADQAAGEAATAGAAGEAGAVVLERPSPVQLHVASCNASAHEQQWSGEQLAHPGSARAYLLLAT